MESQLPPTSPGADSLPIAEDLCRLDEIEEGRCGMVSEVLAGDAEIGQLMAMGVCVGRKVMLVKSGDPLILKVLGSRIGISARLAARVLMTPCGGDMFGEAEPFDG